MVNVQSDRNNVSMASDWHQFAKENHFWFQWRFKTLLKLNVLPVSKQNIFEMAFNSFREMSLSPFSIERSVGRDIPSFFESSS